MPLNPTAMRIRITLERIGHRNVLPINYMYPLSAWIYQVINRADEEYASFLHDQGYAKAGKRFKFFTFSSLQIPRFQVLKNTDRICILSEEVEIILSFYTDRIADKFILGLFNKQHFRLGDRISQVEFNVKNIVWMPCEIPQNTLTFRTLSPLVVSRKNSRGLDDYYPPTQDGYESLLFKNLLDKYMVSGGTLNPDWYESPMEFRLLTTIPKPRLITLKDHTPASTKVKGYLFDFELTAPKELLEIGLMGGFGRYNAEGFGCCEVSGYPPCSDPTSETKKE